MVFCSKSEKIMLCAVHSVTVCVTVYACWTWFVFLDVVIFYIFVGFLCFWVKACGPTIILLWSEPRIARQVLVRPSCEPPVEGMFPLESAWVLTPFHKTLSDKSINRGLVCAHMHSITQTPKILTFKASMGECQQQKTHLPCTNHEDRMWVLL